jgi:SAM-dependent methyltransferase
LTTETPNAQAHTTDFEFRALAEARNYRRQLVAELSPWLRGEVLEVGAGVGQILAEIRRLPAVRTVRALEPEARFAAEFRVRLPDVALDETTTAGLPPGTAFDALVCVNVLEHIRDDDAELRRHHALLRERRGHLCLFVPARPELFAPIDRDFGHWRRYRRRTLRDQLLAAGFTIERLRYYNLPGYFVWGLVFRLLRRRRFSPASVRAFDRWVYPLTHLLETRVCPPPIGQSLLAVARAT